MSTILASLPITPGAVGAPVNTSNLSAKKTLVVSGITGGINIQGSSDGVEFCSVASFSAGGPTERVVNINAAFMRVDATNGGASDVCAMAELGSVRAGVVPTPPSNGPGAVLDVSGFGPETTVYVSGIGGGSVGIEISCDGVNFSSAFKSFTADGCLTQTIDARFVRAVGTGGTATVGIVSEVTVPADPISAFVFRPGATGADAPGGNVYTDEDLIIAALASTAQNGQRIVEFDSRFSPFVNPVTTFPACLITKTWDMSDVILTTRTPAGPGGTFNLTFIEFGDNGVFDHLEKVRGQGLYFLGNSKTGASILLRPGELLQTEGYRVHYMNTDALALPMFEIVGAGFVAMVLSDNTGSAVGGFSFGGSLAPTCKVVNGQTLAFVNTNGYLSDDALTGDGTVYYISETSGAQNAPTDTCQFPTFDADGGTFIFISDQAPRCQIYNGIFTADGDALYSDLTRVDSSAAVADIVITLPPAGPRQGEFVAVKDVGGTANVANQAIVVTAAAGDLIDGAASVTINTAFGALELRNDGGTDWWTI